MRTRNLALTVILAALLGLSFPTQAQVFIQEDDMGANNRVGQFQLGIPHDDDGDHGDDPVNPPTPHAPLGSGAIILGCLGGIYLLGRRRKERE